MVEQLTSDRTFQLEIHQVQPSTAPEFEARMLLVEARTTLVAATRAMRFCGFSQRAGMIAREVCGIKFGDYRPSDIMELMRSAEFQERFEQLLEAWRSGWHAGVSRSSARLRQRQYNACRAFIEERGWSRVADAIESMLAARAQQVVMEDSAGNRRSQRLIDVLDLFFHIPMTGAAGSADAGDGNERVAEPRRVGRSPRRPSIPMQFGSSAKKRALDEANGGLAPPALSRRLPGVNPRASD